MSANKNISLVSMGLLSVSTAFFAYMWGKKVAERESKKEISEIWCTVYTMQKKQLDALEVDKDLQTYKDVVGKIAEHCNR